MNNAKRMTISMPRGLLKKAKARIAELDFAGISDYVQHLIRMDAAAHGVELPPDPKDDLRQATQTGRLTKAMTDQALKSFKEKQAEKKSEVGNQREN